MPGSSGIELVETETFKLHCFQTVTGKSIYLPINSVFSNVYANYTGTKFLLFVEPTQSNGDYVLKRVYELFVDYVLKNPFYAPENPIVRVTRWEASLKQLIEKVD